MSESDGWRILFTLEMNLDAGQYELGAFYCYHWPEQYQSKDAKRNWEATIALLKAAGKDPVKCGVPDMLEISRFLHCTWWRSRVDNKATPALLIPVPRKYSKEFFAEVVRAQDHKTLKRWREEYKVKNSKEDSNE